MFILLGIFFDNDISKLSFFLPPPQTKISLILLCLSKNVVKFSPKILAVNSVSVAAPSSSDNPLANEISKSFVSKETLSLSILLLKSSCACSKIISLVWPLDAIKPLLSNLCFEFFLIQLSIKQFPGPRSLLNIFKDPIGSSIIVAFDMPPILNIQTGSLIFF